MAQKDYIENWRGQADYIEIYRDDYSCRRRFKYREEEEEAQQYFNYLQSLDNQQQSLEKQKEIAEQLKRQNDLVERNITTHNPSQDQKNNGSFPPQGPNFSKPSVTNLVLDPEYKEWLQFKKESDPQFREWKRQKDAEKERIRAEQERFRIEAERKRIQEREKAEAERKRAEAERKREEEAIKREKEKELKPLEDSILSNKKLPISIRIKVASETYREDVMLRCLKYKTGALGFVDALKQNPHITDRVRIELAKKEQYWKSILGENKDDDGCYVATCVYGSYDCPEVWTLRRYRDKKLSKSVGGRFFIKLYYAISPTIVKLFGETKWFKAFWRTRLDRMVSNLRKRGYENTPYDDPKY